MVAHPPHEVLSMQTNCPRDKCLTHPSEHGQRWLLKLPETRRDESGVGHEDSGVNHGHFIFAHAML